MSSPLSLSCTSSPSHPTWSLSSSPSTDLDTTDFLFTPPPSSKPRRRVILDYVFVPPFPKGLTSADYKSFYSVSSTPSRHAVDNPSVGHPLTPSFPQNEQPPLPYLDREGKQHERNAEPTTSLKSKSCPQQFGEGISTVPSTILDAQYPSIDLDVPETPEFLSYFDSIWMSSTYWLALDRFRRDHAELHGGLPEMIAQMKSLAGGNNRKDSPILPQVLAPLFERRGDIAAALKSKWKSAPARCFLRKGKTKNIFDLQSRPSSSKSKLESSVVVPDQISPILIDDDLPISPLTVLEEDPLDLGMEMGQYLNDLGDSPAKPDPTDARSLPNTYCSVSHLSGFLHNPTRLPPDAALATRQDAADSFFGLPPSPNERNLSSPLHLEGGCATDPSHNLDDDSLQLVHPEESPWSLTTDILEQESVSPETVSSSNSTGTIDPSLLGGNQPPTKPPRRPAGIQRAKQLSSGPIIYVRRPRGVSISQEAPSLPGKSRRNIQIKYRTSESVSVTDEGDGLARIQNARELRDDPNWTSDKTVPVASQSQTRQSLKIRIRRLETRAGSDGSFAPSQASSSASPVAPITHVPETKRIKVKNPPPTTQEEDDSDLEGTFCHHCRRTTTKPKMQCFKRRPDHQICRKRFCDRCILNRYPEIEFDRRSKTFVCPFCTDTCNCSICSRKRGEEYISMRGGGFAGSRTKSGIMLVPDGPQTQDKQATSEPPTSAPQTMFWAHVYGLEGERVGRAFIGDANASISAPPTKPPKRQQQRAVQNARSNPKVIKVKKPKQPREFVGAPLREWKVRTFRDLEPSAPIPALVPEEERDNYVGKGKGKAMERPRVYIGDAKWLHMPYGRMPVSARSSRASSPNLEGDWNSDRSLTSFGDLEEVIKDWPQPDVGEAVIVTWESLHERSVVASLSPHDVDKAIHAALAVS